MKNNNLFLNTTLEDKLHKEFHTNKEIVLKKDFNITTNSDELKNPTKDRRLMT